MWTIDWHLSVVMYRPPLSKVVCFGHANGFFCYRMAYAMCYNECVVVTGSNERLVQSEVPQNPLRVSY